MTGNQLYTENELFAQIATGDESAFEQLFDLYLPRIHPVILQIVKEEPATKDIVQDVFLRLWINRDKLPEILDPKSYIFRIVYNQSFKHLKKQLVEEKATATLLSRQQASDSTTSLEETLDMAEVRRLVESAIQLLPPQSKNIYRLNRVDGYKPQLIADELGISVQSVRNSLTRSGKFIREHLESQGVVIPLLLILMAVQ